MSIEQAAESNLKAGSYWAEEKRSAAYPGPNLFENSSLRIRSLTAQALLHDVEPQSSGEKIMDSIFETAAAGIEKIPLSVRRDLETNLTHLAIFESGSRKEKLLGLAGEIRQTTMREILPFKKALWAGRLSPNELRQELKKRSSNRTNFKFGYDEADRFFDLLIGLDPLTVKGEKLIPGAIWYQPTPVSLVVDWLERFPLKNGEVLFDLGCGPGRVVMLAALLTGARVKGVEYAAPYCAFARKLISDNNIRGASIIQSDVMEADLEEADVFYLFNPFEPDLRKRVTEKIRRIATHKPLTVVALGDSQKSFDSCNWLSCVSAAEENREKIAVYRNGFL